jgi:hypothetical protein
MKKFLIIIHILVIASIAKGYGQKQVELDSIYKSINVNNIDTLFDDCNIHFAVVKVNINDNGVVNLNFLNQIPAKLSSLFDATKKIIFNNIHKEKEFVFVYILYPTRKCRPGEYVRSISLENALPEITSLLVDEARKNPNIIYGSIVSSYPDLHIK